MEYRTQKLRDLERKLTKNGGIEWTYRDWMNRGFTRKQIAAQLGMSVPALAAWITKWNKAKEQANEQEVPSS